jgi:DNA (cytosine-5)-methyltransferase 1
MKYGSVCSGIEAATVAWHPLGWEAAWLSEIEPFPSAVLAHHYPNTPNLGDMTLLSERIASGEVEAPDVLCGGTPCQAFSVAGLRNSLDDHRGNLSLTFCEIANAIDSTRLIRGEKPAIIFWENVPGVLNTKDNAFGCFLAGLAGESDALVPPGGRWTDAGFIDGPQRAIAWRVLDAQYFGLAQRRKRVFVVASARNDFDPATVLFEWDGLRRDIAPSREKGKETSKYAGRGVAELCPTIGCELAKQVNNQMVGGAEAFYIPEVYSFDSLASNSMKSKNPISGCNKVDLAKTIDTTIPCPSKNQGGIGIVQEAYSIREDAKANTFSATPLEVSTCVGSLMPSVQSHHAQTFIAGDMAVRRLTPTECERLQGFPDNYTNIPWRKKPESPDGPRYKALGNSWAVPVVAWIGKRINDAIA